MSGFKELKASGGGRYNALYYIALNDILTLPLRRFDTCFFIVENNCLSRFANDVASKLLEYGCRNFEFHGRMRYHWENIIDSVDCERNVDEDDWATTSSIEGLTEFAESIVIATYEDCLLLYDDENLLNTTLQKVLDLWGNPDSL